MAKILLIISALVIAATAYLGFATKQKVDALQSDFTKTKNTLSSTQTTLDKTKATLKKTDEELVAAKADLEVKEKDIAAKKGEIDSLSAKLKETGDNLAAALVQIEEFKKIGDPKDPTVNIPQLMKDIEEMRKSKADLEVKVAELGQVKESLERQVNEQKSKTVAAETQVTAYKTEYTKPGVTGTILAYNPGWNFVVLSIGDKQSLKAGKEMVVTRDGQMVGKVRVKTVETSTSIADVIPSSVPKGQSVQPGDRVVYEGQPK